MSLQVLGVKDSDVLRNPQVIEVTVNAACQVHDRSKIREYNRKSIQGISPSHDVTNIRDNCSFMICSYYVDITLLAQRSENVMSIMESSF